MQDKFNLPAATGRLPIGVHVQFELPSGKQAIGVVIKDLGRGGGYRVRFQRRYYTRLAVNLTPLD